MGTRDAMLYYHAGMIAAPRGTPRSGDGDGSRGARDQSAVASHPTRRGARGAGASARVGSVRRRELLAFVRLGFGHITDPGALDHILFLLALAAIYRGREWRAIWVVSAFTVGHSITLALAVTGAVTLPTPL